jgi:hypothetical protein
MAVEEHGEGKVPATGCVTLRASEVRNPLGCERWQPGSNAVV